MKLGRIRILGTALQDWSEVDAALRRIGECDLAVEAIEAGLTTEVARLKEEAGRQAKPLQEERNRLVRDVKEFVEENRDDLGTAKSRVLNFGTVGFRLSTKLVVKRIAETLKRLHDLGLTACIRVKEEVDKEALREYGDELLRQVGVERKTEDAFFLDVDRERVRRAS